MDRDLTVFQNEELKVKDPVCGMQFAPEKAGWDTQFASQGRTYYFCNKSCLEKFRSDPAKYLQGHSAKAQPPLPPQKATPGAIPARWIRDLRQSARVHVRDAEWLWNPDLP